MRQTICQSVSAGKADGHVVARQLGGCPWSAEVIVRMHTAAATPQLCRSSCSCPPVKVMCIGTPDTPAAAGQRVAMYCLAARTCCACTLGAAGSAIKGGQHSLILLRMPCIAACRCLMPVHEMACSFAACPAARCSAGFPEAVPAEVQPTPWLARTPSLPHLGGGAKRQRWAHIGAVHAAGQAGLGAGLAGALLRHGNTGTLIKSRPWEHAGPGSWTAGPGSWTTRRGG